MYKSFDKIVCRFPHYPVDVLEKALSDESEFLKIIESGYFKNAILSASPNLQEELIKYIRNELHGKDKERTQNALFRYLVRMTTRPTPFGLFASCATGKIDEKTKIILNEKTIVHARLDRLCLCNLVQILEKIPEISSRLNYFVNTSLYAKGNKLRYIEYKFNTQKRIYRLVEISNNTYLSKLLKEAKTGIDRKSMIALVMSSVDDISEEEASAYIDEIIENQLIVSEIDPIITGVDFFSYIVSVMNRIEAPNPIRERLSTIQNLLAQLSENEDGDKKEAFDRIEEEIKALNVPYQKKFLLQVDSIRETIQANLGKEIKDSLLDCMDFLNKITPRREVGIPSKFKEKFSERYESREIPLLEALDPELGIGYPAGQVRDIHPLIAGLNLPGQVKNETQYSQSSIYSILQKKIMSFNPAIDQEIILTGDDVKHLSSNWNDLPATIHVKVEVVKKIKDTDEYLLSLSAFSGSNGANLLGRFAYCDPGIRQLTDDIVEKEKEIYSNYIVAEIAHIPDSRVGNVIARPRMRDYEILYLANTTRNRENVIYPSDIMISVKNNQILLRSKTLDKYIIPRLTNAHNYHNDPTPVYLFLCDLQTQNLRGFLSFQWNSLEILDYLPQVRYKNIILSPAKWKIKTKSMDTILKQKGDAGLKQAVNEWRKKLRLPRYVTLTEHDNTLFIDMENIFSIKAFISTLSNKKQIILEEFLFDESSPVKNQQGDWFTNEFIVAFYKS
jgi:hypothetical protein